MEQFLVTKENKNVESVFYYYERFKTCLEKYMAQQTPHIDYSSFYLFWRYFKYANDFNAGWNLR